MSVNRPQMGKKFDDISSDFCHGSVALTCWLYDEWLSYLRRLIASVGYPMKFYQLLKKLLCRMLDRLLSNFRLICRLILGSN